MGVADMDTDLSVAPEPAVQDPDVMGGEQEHPVPLATAVTVTGAVSNQASRRLHHPDPDEAVF